MEPTLFDDGSSAIDLTPQTIKPCPVAAPQTAPTPMMLLQMAMDQGADLDRLERLMDMNDRWEKSNARKAFIEAMAEFKKNAPTIVKDKKVAFDGTSYKHAELDQVCDKVNAALSLVGISHRWTVAQKESRICVTCILTHIMGHSEEVTLESGADTSGKKNAIQAIASAVTYLQRYTLLASCGLATGADDDGRMGADQAFGMTEEVFQGHLKAIREAATIATLQTAWTTAWNAAKSDKPTQKAILDAKDKRKAELAGGAK